MDLTVPIHVCSSCTDFYHTDTRGLHTKCAFCDMRIPHILDADRFIWKSEQMLAEMEAEMLFDTLSLDQTLMAAFELFTS